MAEANPSHLYYEYPILLAVHFWAGMETSDTLYKVVCSTLDACLVENLRISSDSASGVMVKVGVRYQNKVGFQLWKALVEPARSQRISIGINDNPCA